MAEELGVEPDKESKELYERIRDGAELRPVSIAGHLAGDDEGGLDFLETDLRDVPARQRSMRVVFDHSWNLLSAREQEALARTSVFHGGFTRQAAQAVAGAGLRTLRGGDPGQGAKAA